MVLVSQYWRQRAAMKEATPSVRHCIVDEERMSPGHWLGLVLYV